LVADTHTIIWYLTEPTLLSRAAYRSLSQARLIYVSAISVVEIRYLIEKGTVTEAALNSLVDFLNDPGVTLTLVPLDLDIALALGQIPRKAIPDMPDRIIAATAWHLRLPLVTRDTKIQASGIQTIW
jgi:PIN domain nuclease of toxin-antitoxin system